MKAQRFFIKLRKNFFTGLLVFLPVTASLYIVYIVLVRITDFFIKYFPRVYTRNFQFIICFRIFTLILIIFLIILVSIFARNFIGKKLYALMESVFLKIPIINRIYYGLKQILEGYSKLILDKNQTLVSRVCLVPFAAQGTYALGLVTSKTPDGIENISDNGFVSILIPSTPAPLAGFYIMAPEKDIIPLDMPVQDALIMAASGGIVTPPFQVNPDFSHDSGK